ncbi:Rsd/AlgQ family anti-sigma factor, partial [Streptomyces sp. P9(2023)]|uniref:Rsd/AlgQ family anti-sigma factor n=1 Tax=Streptomyces sp. P9(2023) TaxID=3064394 RepID=UPI0028F408A0
MVMLNKLKKTQEQWGGSSEVIDHWLDNRQHLIVEYCKLAALQPLTPESSLNELPAPKALHRFSQELVDHIINFKMAFGDIINQFLA